MAHGAGSSADFLAAAFPAEALGVAEGRYVDDRTGSLGAVFRLQGEEDYWYKRTITDLLPEGNSLMLDHQLVRIEDIAALKISRKGYVRLIGSSLLTFGVSMGVAITAAVLYRDFDYNFPALIGAGAGSFLAGTYLLTPRKIKMGDKFRLRIIEIRFGDTAPPKS